MLSDKKKSDKVVPSRKVGASQKSWGDKQKRETVETYVILGGNAMQTCAAMGVPQETLRQWRHSSWWKELYDEIKQEDNILISHRLKNIMSKSLSIVEDRLEKGDYFFDQKIGKAVRKEISLKDAHDVLNSSFKMKETLERPQEVVLEEGSVMDKLTTLAKQFEQFAGAQKAKPAVEVTDVIYIEEKNT